MDEIRKPKPFAHVIDVLRGNSRAQDDKDEQAKRAAADDEDKKDDDKSAQGDEDDDKEKKTKKAQGDEDDDKDKKKTKKASDKDDEGRDNDEKKAWRSKDDPRCEEDSVAARMALWPEAGSDAADRADDRDPGLAAARAREQGRIRAILNSEAGTANPTAAIGLALNSALSRRAAIAVIMAMPEEQPQPRRFDSSLRERMADVKMPAILADGGSPPGISAPQGSPEWAAQTAAAIVAAGKRRRGEA